MPSSSAALRNTLWGLPVRPDVFPLLVAVSGACVLGAAFGVRTLLTNPDVRINKADRQTTVYEDEHFYSEGQHFHNHWLRRWSKGAKKDIFSAITERFEQQDDDES